MDEAFRRITESTECRTQLELANFFGTRQAFISNVKRCGIIPKDWLTFLQKTKGIRPEWILSGIPPQYEEAGE